jgi:hypothetical protein
MSNVFSLREVRGVDRSPVPGAGGLRGGSRAHYSLPLSATTRAGFLKSRVYAKLGRGLFWKHYQTFNGHFACLCRDGQNSEAYRIGK